MITVIDENNKTHEIQVVRFSDGCYTVKVPSVKPVTVSVKIDDAIIDMHLLDLVVSAYSEMQVELNNLFLPYLPNARADRVFETGNPFPLKVTAHINSWAKRFKSIHVYDLHSDASNYFLPVGVVNTPQNVLVKNYCHTNFDVICSPDKGAAKKSEKISTENNIKLISANKVRDISTGKIINTEITSECDLTGKVVLISDDICDGGGTFIPLAKLLKERGAKSVVLFVSHGIFSKGLDIFNEYIDKIYTANIVCNYVDQFDLQKFNLRNGE